MKTATDRLAFAVRFAETDLDSLRPGDWTNLRDDLSCYLGIGDGWASREDRGFTGMSTPAPRKATEGELRKLRAEVNRVLRSVVVGVRPFRKLRADKGAPRAWTLTGEPSSTTVTWSTIPSSPSVISLLATGTLQDLFLCKLYFLLGSVGVEAVQECPACTRIFTRAVRHQKYCNRKCAAKVNLESWLNSPKGKRYAAAQRKAARKRYERTVAEKSPGAKPAPYKPRKKATRGSAGTRAR